MSLKVIHINGLGDSLTVDNTFVTVDDTNITVDQTIASIQSFTLKVPYRFFETNINFILWNEIKEEEVILGLTASQSDGEMIITFEHGFEDGETYEARIMSLTDKLIWRGKLLATIQTDLENYILHKVTDNNIIKI